MDKSTSSTSIGGKKIGHAKSIAHGIAKRMRRTDAIDILIADHQRIRALYAEYLELVDSSCPFAQREELALKICELLSVHARLEKKCFYPIARTSINATEVMNQSDFEHAVAKRVIKTIEKTALDDSRLDARVTVLCEYAIHHFEQEENKLFPLVRSAGIDLIALGAIMLARRELQLEDASPVG